MNITRDKLLACIEDATKQLTVMVPSTDYYRRPGDTEESVINYIDAYALKSALEELYE